MEDLLLVLNAGSSSIKFAVYEKGQGGIDEICAGQAEGLASRPIFTAKRGETREEHPLPGPGHGQAIGYLATWLRQAFPGRSLRAVGHRVVHGGDFYSAPVLITQAVLDRLQSLVPLVPLHQPHNLAPARTLLAMMPKVPQVACFDTAFHQTMPRIERLFALPRALIEEGVRRYGFHGLSYEYVSRRLGLLAPDLAKRRVVIAHLGSGASMCALKGGKSMATTMGLTGLDGLPMGTRSGSVDPGILLYLLQSRGLDANGLEKLLYHQSGLLGVSGISGDMRLLLESDAASAREAVDLFVLKAARELASLAAALEGLDGLVFTAGIGERSSAIREMICRKAAWLGIELDASANQAGELRISTPASPISVLVIPTDENRVIAEQMVELLEG